MVVLGCAGGASAGYLDEVGSETFAEVYQQLGITLPEQTAHDPQIWSTLSHLKRESCDQKSLDDLAILLDRLGYRREAAVGQYNFVKKCGGPTIALHKSIDLLLKLSDFVQALEVADEFVRRAPTTANAHYLRGVALHGVGDHNRALIDFANAIELYGDRSKISSTVFLRMADAYAKLERYCEAVTPILTWVAIDPLHRDNSRSQKIIADYELKGNCAASNEFRKERFAAPAGGRVILAKVEINGIKGVFIIDTGASYVSLKKDFADRAKIAYANGGEITLSTANGLAKGKLAKAEAVGLGKLRASNVPVVVQDTDARSYGSGVDGLLGMSFLSRFDLQISGGFIEIHTRQRK
jgi:aspartyl protease family protein